MKSLNNKILFILVIAIALINLSFGVLSYYYDDYYDDYYNPNYYYDDYYYDDYYYDDGYYYSSGSDFVISFIIYSGIFIIILMIGINNANRKSKLRDASTIRPRYNAVGVSRTAENAVLAKVQAVDDTFSGAEFKDRAAEIFVKLQKAWSDRDLATLREFESDDLYDIHSAQIEQFISDGKINKVEDVAVVDVKLLSFEQKIKKDYLSIAITSKMKDYFVEELSGKIIKGNFEACTYKNYKLTFSRDIGDKVNWVLCSFEDYKK